MSRLFADAATQQQPKHIIETAHGNQGRLLAAVGMDKSTTLKASRWQALFDGAATTPDTTFFSLVKHLGGGTVYDTRNPIRCATPGTAGILDWNEPQEWYCKREIQFAHFYIPVDLVRDVAQSLFDKEFRMDDVEYFIASDKPGIHQVLDAAIYALFSEQLELTDLVLDGWGIILAEALLRTHSIHSAAPAQLKTGQLPDACLNRVIDYIDANIDKALGLDELAKVAGRSVFHFARCFKLTMGLSPHAYVMLRRVEAAKLMLANSNKPLMQVACECGFSSQSHLTSVFARHVGMPPGKFRREMLK